MSTLSVSGNPAGGGSVVLRSHPGDTSRVIALPDADLILGGSARVDGGPLPSAAATSEIVVPEWATRITVSIDALSTNAANSTPRIRLAHSSTTGTSVSHFLTYVNGASPQGNQGANLGAVLAGAWAAAVQISGTATLRRHGPLVWFCHWRGTHIQGGTTGAIISESVTRFTYSNEPDRLNLITGSADLFDAGNWNVEFHA